jgi:hypothetical protein
MMLSVLHDADGLLRGARLDRADALPLPRIALLVVVFGICYGAVMGTFSATSPQRFLLVIYAAIKVPILLLVTFGISLPSFFVLNTLLGMRRDFADAIRALITTQAGLTIILASLAPFTAVFYASSSDYASAILFNALMFAIASLSAQFLLRRLYRPLIQRNARHRILLRLWLVIYMFVGIQMGWVLRPFVGSPYSPTVFFREGAFSNAYEVVGRLILEVLGKFVGWGA